VELLDTLVDMPPEVIAELVSFEALELPPFDATFVWLLSSLVLGDVFPELAIADV
jgi:hypothetical protein